MADGANERPVVEPGVFDTMYRATRTQAYRKAIARFEPQSPPWFRPTSAIDAELLGAIVVAAGIDARSDVLDIGCGGGDVAVRLASERGCTVTGIDFAPAAVDAAQRLAADVGVADRVRFRVADATATGCADGSLDAVVSVYVLMFVDAHAAFTEIARVLRPGGRAAIVVQEAAVDPPRFATSVPDYQPAAAAAGLEMTRVPLGEDAWKSFWVALNAVRSELLAEAGDVAQPLVAEAERALTVAPHGRSVLLTLARR